MILVDRRVGSSDLMSRILQIGVECDLASLEYGDAAFEGQGPHGTILVGVERKTINDVLMCIDDGRLTGHQKPGMKVMYGQRFLIVEGMFTPSSPPATVGMLYEGFDKGRKWGPVRGGRPVLYSKLFRFLMSVQMSGMPWIQSIDPWHTAYNICEMYHWYQKPWSKHTSMLQTQTHNLPEFYGKPSLTRKWAADITDIGVKYSQIAESMFKTPIRLANSQERDWMRIKGIGAKTARQIIKEIQGVKE